MKKLITSLSLVGLVSGCLASTPKKDFDTAFSGVYVTPNVLSISAEEYAVSQGKKLSDYSLQEVFVRAKKHGTCMDELGTFVFVEELNGDKDGVITNFQYDPHDQYRCYGIYLTLKKEQ
ncbi:MAG: hypothetical protein Q8R37_00620 [Nanoarchaeota archaeon]|nr:hypothetical protein [Nanoarchaeota archaeon]